MGRSIAGPGRRTAEPVPDETTSRPASRSVKWACIDRFWSWRSAHGEGAGRTAVSDVRGRAAGESGRAREGGEEHTWLDAQTTQKSSLDGALDDGPPPAGNSTAAETTGWGCWRLVDPTSRCCCCCCGCCCGGGGGGVVDIKPGCMRSPQPADGPDGPVGGPCGSGVG